MEVRLRPRGLVEGLIEPVCVLGAVDGVGVEEGNVGREVVPGHPRLAAPHPGRGVDSGRVLERETVSGETLERGVPRPDLGFVRSKMTFTWDILSSKLTKNIEITNTTFTLQNSNYKSCRQLRANMTPLKL